MKLHLTLHHAGATFHATADVDPLDLDAARSLAEKIADEYGGAALVTEAGVESWPSES